MALYVFPIYATPFRGVYSLAEVFNFYFFVFDFLYSRSAIFPVRAERITQTFGFPLISGVLNAAFSEVMRMLDFHFAS
jgi:hypothetical protein